MTLTDFELETRLRDQRTRAEEIAPATADLAQRVRQRAREQHRRRVALAAAGVAAALVFVGLPVLASDWLPDGSRSESAGPPSRRPADDVPAYNEIPTRGSLAGDEEWLAQVADLSWQSPELIDNRFNPGSPLYDPPLDRRHVAFAGDVPGGRVALVLGFDGRLAHAWYVGPEGAEPEAMSLAVLPSESSQREPMVLWTRPDPASEDQVLVVVGLPGDELDVLTGREVTAAGETKELWQTVDMADGAGALSPERPFSWAAGVDFRLRRDGQREPIYPYLEMSEDTLPPARVTVADPKGVAGAVDPRELQSAAQSLVSHYGLPSDQLRPTLLAAGPVGAGSTTSAILIGVTFPSGATGALVGTYWSDGQQVTMVETTFVEPAPAGTPLLDRVIAVASSNALTVSGPPEGAMVEVYLADGSPFSTMPLLDGTGIGPLPPPGPPRSPEIARIRILDARGSFVTEAPVEVVG